MSAKLVLRPEAEAELAAAYAWYESRLLGLGDAFLACVEGAFEQARAAPRSWPVIHGSVRRILVRRFPYGVFYVHDPESLVGRVRRGRGRGGSLGRVVVSAAE